jgi:hypothetical protein
MTLDESIVSVVRFLDLVHSDVARVLQAADSFMSEAGYNSLWGTPCYFNASKAAYQSSQWSPKTFARVYLREEERKEYGRMGFFNVYLAPANWTYPIVMWGWANKKKNIDDFWSPWCKYVIGSSPVFAQPEACPCGLTQLLPRPSTSFSSRENAAVGLAPYFDSFWLAVTKLTGLTDERELKTNVIEPLISSLDAAYESSPSPTGAAVD